MKRKINVLTLCAALFALGFPAEAQQLKKIGVLFPSNPAATAHLFEAFSQGLRDRGYVDGKTIVLERRYGESKAEKIAELARELVSLKVDVIVTATDVAIAAVKTRDSDDSDCDGQQHRSGGTGFVASLARPGGNITGHSTISPELSGKRLELLREVVPKLSRVAFLWNPDVRGAVLDYNQTEAAASSQGLQLQSVEVARAEDFDRGFSAITKDRAQALIVLAPNPLGFANRGQIASFAQKNKLPSMYGQNEYVDAGGLMSYGPNNTDLWRRAATFVDKILKGTKPADLPVEQPMKFELIINLKTAKQIGLTIPPNVLVRADTVIK
jgi:putative tryptophan/tyrosine transport system substrate-binding protein